MANTRNQLPIDNNFIETKKVTQKTEQGENKHKERFRNIRREETKWILQK